jgi:hypothetical protein
MSARSWAARVAQHRAGSCATRAHFEASASAPDAASSPASALRATHVALASSQRWPGHCASLLQPTRHVNVLGSQMGAACPQSELEVQASHAPVRIRHRGFDAVHVASETQSTHVRRAAEHTPDGQSASVVQPTHAPDALSQAEPDGHGRVSLHGAWHSSSVDQHVLDGAGQSDIPASATVVAGRQPTHVPSRQCVAAAGQSSSCRHSTHPRPSSQRRNGPQSLRPFAPHSAPDPFAVPPSVDASSAPPSAPEPLS